MKRTTAIHVAVLIACFCTGPARAESEKVFNNPATIRAIHKSKNPSSIGETLYLDLESSLGLAITNNYDLKAINASKQIYDLTIMERFRDFFPSLTFSYSNLQTSVLRGTDTRSQKFRIDSEIVIYDGGKRKLAYDISKLKAILARNDYRIAVNQLTAQVLAAYLDILEYKGAIEIDRITLEHGLMQLGFIQKELELGEATRLQVMEIDARVKEVELELEKAINSYTVAKNNFKLLLKLDYRQPIDLTGDVERDFILKPPSANKDPDELVAYAERNRKEIESSEIEASIDKKAYSINRLYYFPQFSIGLNYSLSDDQARIQQFVPREKGWGISFKVTGALFGNTYNAQGAYDTSLNGNTRTMAGTGTVGVLDNMSYKRGIVESKIQYLTALERAKEAKQQIAVEVLSSMIDLDNTWRMINIAKKQVELYDKSLEIERIKANMGETTRYDVIEKEIYRWRAAISYLDSKIRYLKAGSALELAMGADIGSLKLYNIRTK